jgi:predicted porin
MKKLNKSVLALAALSTLSGLAMADGSSLTIYGRIDEAFNKPIGYTAATSNTISGPYNSRLGFMGTEDLGDGWKGVFNLEHRFSPDTGASYKANTFWYGRAVVGLDSPYGRILLGREYTPMYTLVGVPGSPWGGDSLATNKIVTLGGTGANSTIDPQRMNKSVNYSITTSGFTFQAQWADKYDNNGSFNDVSNPGDATVGATGALKRRPFGLGAAYAQGPVYVALAYTNPGDPKDKWTALTGSYNFDVVKLGATYGTGRVSTAVTAQAGDREHAWNLYAIAPAGSGEFRLSYGQLKDKDHDVDVHKFLAVGYYYNMSKRTHLYADYIRDNADYNATFSTGVKANKNGYEVGIRHDF